MFMNHISSLDKEAYSSPSCSIIEVVVETSFLSGFDPRPWEKDPDEL